VRVRAIARARAVDEPTDARPTLTPQNLVVLVSHAFARLCASPRGLEPSSRASSRASNLARPFARGASRAVS
jgi:hypothetical protein